MGCLRPGRRQATYVCFSAVPRMFWPWGAPPVVEMAAMFAPLCRWTVGGRPLSGRAATGCRRSASAPRPRAFDLSNPTTALHQSYHDRAVHFTMENFERVKSGSFGTDVELATSAERVAIVQRAARERLFRFPALSPLDVQRVCFGAGPQRFCEAGAGDPGENIFIVSLLRRPSKLRRSLQQLKQHGLDASIVSAVDGDALRSQEDLRALGVDIVPGYRDGHENHRLSFTTGEVGCFLSHFTIWQHMVQKRMQSALILEDDFDLQEGFRKRLGLFLQEAAHEQWNLMYVGRSPMEEDLRSVSQHIKEPGYTLWTVAYILRLDGAEALVNANAAQAMVPLDEYFSLAMGRMDSAYNRRGAEFGRFVPSVLRGLAMEPPLVMPWVGAMFESDTAMMRSGTRFVKDLPRTDAEASTQRVYCVSSSSGWALPATPMEESWHGESPRRWLRARLVLGGALAGTPVREEFQLLEGSWERRFCPPSGSESDCLSIGGPAVYAGRPVRNDGGHGRNFALRGAAGAAIDVLFDPATGAVMARAAGSDPAA